MLTVVQTVVITSVNISTCIYVEMFHHPLHLFTETHDILIHIRALIQLCVCYCENNNLESTTCGFHEFQTFGSSLSQNFSASRSASVSGPAGPLCHLLRRGCPALSSAATLDRRRRALGLDVLPSPPEANPGGETRTPPRAPHCASAAPTQQLHGGCDAVAGQHPQNTGTGRRRVSVCLPVGLMLLGSFYWSLPFRLCFVGYESEMQRRRQVSQHRDLRKGVPDQPSAAGGPRPLF